MRFIMAITSLNSTPQRVTWTGSSWSSCWLNNSDRKGLKGKSAVRVQEHSQHDETFLPASGKDGLVAPDDLLVSGDTEDDVTKGALTRIWYCTEITLEKSYLEKSSFHDVSHMVLVGNVLDSRWGHSVLVEVAYNHLTSAYYALLYYVLQTLVYLCSVLCCTVITVWSCLHVLSVSCGQQI